MALVSATTFHSDYYVQRTRSWVYFGLGMGIYRSSGKLPITNTDDFGNNFQISGVSKEKAFGVAIRAGQKVGMLNAGLELNLVGKQLPNYANLNIGIEVGATKKLLHSVKKVIRK